LSQWAPVGRGPRCLAPAAPMVVTPLHIPSWYVTRFATSCSLLKGKINVETTYFCVGTHAAVKSSFGIVFGIIQRMIERHTMGSQHRLTNRNHKIAIYVESHSHRSTE